MYPVKLREDCVTGSECDGIRIIYKTNILFACDSVEV